ncbi:helix-turn-helix transcriptional regulator [Longispora fulva]|uniref:AraC-like DNA-binding protein n=1 Tax=Longispora fulva TaxID=619741 RepID=A0A8J7KL87_9ACTN|nr:helix-turn-helix domain-containing protein [Longispora fulva]MBG6139039.1 AraC-like DNA-binding protein [Longispora fulva]
MYRERPAVGGVLWAVTVPAGDAGTSRILPDGSLDLIWADGTLLVAGPDTTAHLAVSAPGARFVGLRFAPGTGPTVLGVPACEVRDQRVPLADLWPAARVRRYADRITGSTDRPGELESLVAELLGETGPPDPLLAAVAGRLRAGHTVAGTAAAVGLSDRQLHRRSLAGFGYGAKTLARVFRLDRALGLARSGRAFADVATTAGYADQAHLSREVRALTGVTLGELR